MSTTKEEFKSLLDDIKIISTKVHISKKYIGTYESYQFDGKSELWKNICILNDEDILAAHLHQRTIFFKINKKNAYSYNLYFKSWNLIKINKDKNFFINVGSLKRNFLEDILIEKPHLVFEIDTLQRLQQKMFASGK
jgi:hypothetical protein